VFRNIFVLLLLASHLVPASFANAGELEVKVPAQLVGHCLEEGGRGSLKVEPDSTGDQFTFKCTYPAVRQGELGNNDIHQLGLQWDKPSQFGGAAFLRGWVGTGYARENGRYLGRIDIEITVSCGYYGGRVCRRDDVLRKARELGDFSHTKVRLVSSRSNGGGNPSGSSSVCIVPGPGYPNGPECFQYSPVDPVSGSYCRVWGTNSGVSVCLEYGNVNPRYP
jgi:hypothetical protein